MPATDNHTLDHATAAELVIRRVRRGRGFSYLDANGRAIRDPETMDRIRRLAIPPAYADVRISANPQAHLQAIGRDAAGRWQHRYHPDWTKTREAHKAARLADLVAALPRIRAAVARDMGGRRPDRERALAAAVALIDETHIRVGSESYLQSSGARGAATLLKRQASFAGRRAVICFRGKGGARIRCAVADPRLSAMLKRIASLPGARLFQYLDAGGRPKPIRAGEINAYLARIAGTRITAKDLRMLAASAAAAEALGRVEPELSDRGRRHQILEVVTAVAADLANTPAVARKSYVAPAVVEAFVAGELSAVRAASRSGRLRRRGEMMLGRLMAAKVEPAEPR